MADVTFYNHGNYEIILKNKRDGSEHRIEKGENSSITVKGLQLGDGFNIENVSEPQIEYRPVYITDPGVTNIKLQGNIPFGKWDSTQTRSKLDIAEFESNRYGIDLTTLNPRLVVTSFSDQPIFEGLKPESVDYEIQSGKIIKTGMTFSETNVSKGNSQAQMAYSYSAFSKDWNINVGGSVTVPTKKPGTSVTGSLDFGYNQFETEERSSTNVYAYTREQKAVYEVGLDPNNTYLDWTFMREVKRVQSVQDAVSLIKDYGTHYPTKVYYGGDRSAYITMNNSTYAKAKGYGINIKGKLSASQKEMGSKGKIKPKTRNEDIASGTIGIGYSESREEKEISQQTKSGYWAVGGVGGFDDWSISADDAVAVAVNLEPLYDLISAKIFKDGTPQSQLDQHKKFIKQAIDEHLKHLKTLDAPLPAPKVYSLTFDRMEATQVVDDLEKRTSGHVVAKVDPALPNFDGTLWYQQSANSNFRYKQNQPIFPNVTKRFVQFPSQNGSFAPIHLHLEGDIAEKDHLGGSEHHRGSSPRLDLNNLAIAQSQKIEFDCKAFRTHAEKGTIRVTATLRREPSEFIDSRLPFEPKEAPPISPSQPLQILHQAHPNFCLNLNGNDARDGQIINLWSVNGHDSQRWELREDGTIRHQAHPNFCLNLHNNDAKNGAIINLWSVNGNESQRWELREDGTIRHQAHPNFCLNLHGNNAGDGATVNLWSVNGHESQRWQLGKEGASS